MLSKTLPHTIDQLSGAAMKRVCLTSAIAIVFYLTSSVPDSALAQKLVVGNTSIGAPGLPVWVAYETGIFKRNGLDAQAVWLGGGGPITISVILSGEAHIYHGAGNGVVASNLGGSDLVMIAGGTTSINYWLMSRSETKSREQLKGGAIAIGGFGSTTDFAARVALQKLGLVPGKDVTIVPSGNNPTRMGAVESGRMQATPLEPPASILAQKRGLHLLMDISALNVSFPHTGPSTTRKFIQNNTDVVRRFIKSYVEAVHRIKTDRKTGMTILSKYFKGLDDKEVVDKTYDLAFRDSVMPRKQYPTLEGIRIVLDSLAQKDAKAKQAKPEDFVDMRFIKELDESGFIDNLYK
jgi:ABC-type nitrate/sulfonate/bicarbonate transport system substrate-binding protein